jgi:peptidoglycan/xylan/chitin deacetylase (PgdA/CDA1 family)
MGIVSLAGGAFMVRENDPPPSHVPRAVAVLKQWPEELVRGPRGRREIALTFDAGGEAGEVDRLLAALRDEGIVSTFFLTGKWAVEYPAEARAIVEQGHEPGNHTWSHPELTTLPDDEVRNELLRAEAQLEGGLGVRVRPRFRAPFGDRDDRILRLAAETGYQSCYWTVDSLDSVEPRKTAAFLHRRITRLSDAQLEGAIVLFHVGYPETCDALPLIIRDLRGRGFRFVRLSEWMGPSQRVPGDPFSSENRAGNPAPGAR